MKNLYLLLVITTLSFDCYSQDVSFLKGIVFNDSINVSDITVTNKNLRLSTKTNKLGVFEVPIRFGDSILVSAIHINKVLLFVTPEIVKKGEIEIEVNEKLNEMEVVVLNNILSSSALDFSSALKPSKQGNEDSMRRMEITRMANTDPTAIFGGGGGGGTGAFNILKPVFILTNILVKKIKGKSLSRQEKNKNRKIFEKEFIEEFGMSFFTDELKISEFLVDKFILYCDKKQSLYLMYSKDEKIELIDFLMKQSTIYKKEMNIDN